ncbi:MAG: phenylalanine--tRNA ligase subunit beta [Methylocystaceae bacterium]
MMRVPLEWLNDYIEITDLRPEELAARLTMAGIPVEGIDHEDGDTILELELTPNRGDCNGMINLAREVAALYDRKLKFPSGSLQEMGSKPTVDMVQVKITDEELCARYAARVVTAVKVAPSPDWMQRRLEHAGIRPINNIVDITNYVMLEYNQPLHAFDFSLVKAGQIVVRRANAGETMTTLDEVERQLTADMLVIADDTQPIALAGVMGGRNSEITSATAAVLLESANFHYATTRRTAAKLALRTEASARYEKGLNPESVLPAVNRAAELIEELGAGIIAPGVVDVYPRPAVKAVIALRPERVNRILGSKIAGEQMGDYLKSLGFGLTPVGRDFQVEVPFHRVDVSLEADLIEEIARLYGYDNIPSTLPSGQASVTGHHQHSLARQVIAALAHNFYQVVSYSFISPRYLDRLNQPADSLLKQPVAIANPLSEEHSVMRTTLLPGLLETAIKNMARQNDDLAIFEVGNVFYSQGDDLPGQQLMAAGLGTGKTEATWLGNRQEMDFFFLKGLTEDFLTRLGISGFVWQPLVGYPSYHPGRSAQVLKGDTVIMRVGELHPEVLEQWGIKKRVVAFEAALDDLQQARPLKRQLEDIARYPAVYRDLAVVLSEEITAGQVQEVAWKAGGELLRAIQLFDVYRSDHLGADKKSLALKLKFQADDRTLREEEINELVRSILQQLASELGAVLR